MLYNEDGSYRRLHTARVDAVEEIVESAQGSPVLVMYRFKAELDMLRERFGDMVYDSGTKNLQARWNRDELPILAAHPQSVGHGLNLQEGGGHTVVWMSPTWSGEEFNQANKRLHRSGQRNAVMVHHIMAPGTVDDLAAEARAGKLRTESELRAALER